MAIEQNGVHCRSWEVSAHTFLAFGSNGTYPHCCYLNLGHHLKISTKQHVVHLCSHTPNSAPRAQRGNALLFKGTKAPGESCVLFRVNQTHSSHSSVKCVLALWPGKLRFLSLPKLSCQVKFWKKRMLFPLISQKTSHAKSHLLPFHS